MIVAKNCYFWSVFAQISGGGYPPNSSKFPQPQFLLTCTYFGGRRHGRSLPLAKATDGLAFGVTRHCRIEGLPPMPPTPAIWRRRSKVKRCMFQYKQSNGPMRNSKAPQQDSSPRGGRLVCSADLSTSLVEGKCDTEAVQLIQELTHPPAVPGKRV